jgi:SAM-dependent methyltransferase
VGERVLSFYKQLPFNYYSNALDMARDLMAVNAIAEYPPLYKYLRERPESRVLDVGCGAGWFVNSCTNFHDSVITGIDLNPVALKQARAVSRFVKGGERATFVQSDVFDFEPSDTFDVVSSLGVLHHTHDCHAAIRQAVKWVAPGGYLHLGLYHLYGRRPFLQHFAKIRAAGGSEEDQYREFARLNPNITDETHLTSWFRDQVLHPFETQHTFAEIAGLLEEEGFGIEATSINRFKRMPEMTKLFAMEKEYEALSERALNRRGKYFPGFFVVWARKH